MKVLQNDTIIVLPIFFNEDEALAFIDHYWHEQTYYDYKIYIVVNGTKQLRRLVNYADNDGRIQVLFPKIDTGYLGAAHWALQHYQQQHHAVPGLLLLADHRLHFGNDFLTQLRQAAIQLPTADVIGVRLSLQTDDAALNPVLVTRPTDKKLARLYQGFQNGFYHWFFKIGTRPRRWIANNATELSQPQTVYALHPALLTFKSSFFEKGGSLDMQNHKGFEHLFLAEQAYHKQLQLWYTPAVAATLTQYTPSYSLHDAVPRKAAKAALSTVRQWQSAS